MRVSRPLLFVALVIAPLVVCSRAQAINPADVLILYNSNPAVPESLEIANYYKQVYPDVNLLGLNLGTASTISATEYLTNIRNPILMSPTPSSSLIVTTKGMPLKVHVEASNPGAYTDPYTNNRSVLTWQTESSLESELTKIDYIATQEMMGDQSWVIGNFTQNQYYLSTSPFSSTNFTGEDTMRLTARLDGFSVADVTGAIDRAQNAFIGPNNTPSGPFHFIVDALDPGDPYQIAASPMTNLAENVLPAAGMPMTYDNTGAFQRTADGPVIGYTGHGAHQPSIVTTAPYVPGEGSYVINNNGLDFTLADGAVFNSWESFNAQSFDLGGNSGNQGLVAEWLAKGGTAGLGNVDEPGASITTVFNEDQLFASLLAGNTFAEAAWSSARQLSWVNTVVGDPLMTWKQLLPGDANMDGVVDMGDLAAMSPFWGRSVEPGGFGWAKGDVNGDGFVDFFDLTLVSASWGQVSAWSTTSPNLSDPSSPLTSALFSSIHPSPEPSTIALLGIGLALLAAFGWRRARTSRRP